MSTALTWIRENGGPFGLLLMGLAFLTAILIAPSGSSNECVEALERYETLGSVRLSGGLRYTLAMRKDEMRPNDAKLFTLVSTLVEDKCVVSVESGAELYHMAGQ